MNTEGVTIEYYDRVQKQSVTLPLMGEDIRKKDLLNAFYKGVKSAFENKLSMRFDRDTQSLVIRHNERWQGFTIKEEQQFWTAVWFEWPKLVEVNWATDRLHKLYQYFFFYPTDIEFKSQRYFELKNTILDVETGKLYHGDNRHLDYPTFRSTPHNYNPGYKPSKSWKKWFDAMTEEQKQVRAWSVGSAVCGGHGALMTFGNTRTGKSTLAEGLSEVLNGGARKMSISQDWGRFQTSRFRDTTYLFDPDAKGSKQQNNRNYETLHLMMCGDPIGMEIKGGNIFESQRYGFLEIISNDPVGIRFEPSLVDRVRFCLYTYIDPRGDGGNFKKWVLSDTQAWANYAIDSAIKLAKGKIERPPLNYYQALGWYHFLKNNNDYAELCFRHRRYLSYTEYIQFTDKNTYYRISKDTMDQIYNGMQEINRQLGEDITKVDWDDYEEQLKREYYGIRTKQKTITEVA